MFPKKKIYLSLLSSDRLFQTFLLLVEIIKSNFLQNDPEEDDTEEEEGEDAGYDSDDMDDIANDLPFDPVGHV